MKWYGGREKCGKEKKNKKETMGYQENTRNLFLISSISLEKFRRDDSNCNWKTIKRGHY
jgi:hypothetical protein